MRGLILATVSLFSLGAVAAPAAACMTSSDAARVAGNFKALINETFNKTLAVTALTKDFTDYSDSVNELINSGCAGPATLGTATFTSRKAFISGQSGQSPIPFEILNTWNTCDAVIIRWVSSAPGTITTTQEQVQGIIVMETKANSHPNPKEPWLIETVYSEFNSGAWLYDLGVFTPTCSSSKRSIAAPRML